MRDYLSVFVVGMSRHQIVLDLGCVSSGPPTVSSLVSGTISDV